MSVHPPAPGTLTLYTTNWCPFCRGLKWKLDEEQIPYTEIDVEEDLDAADFVESVNDGNRTVPTVLFPDGSTLTNPDINQVRRAL